MNRILIFGTGTYYEQRKEYLKDVEILAFLDNDSNKQGKLLDGIKIVSPQEAGMYSYDYVLLMSVYQYDMKKQLLGLDVKINKILEYTEIGRLSSYNKGINNQYKFYIDSEREEKKRALLITNNLENSGAPRALEGIGKILRKQNYEVYVISPVNGRLEEYYRTLGMHVLIEPDLTLTNIDFLQWFKSMKLNVCFVNTIVYHHLINEIQKYGIPLIWWIHENSELPVCCFESYEMKKKSNLKVCVVGSMARKAMSEKFQFTQLTELLYGFDDKFNVKSNLKNNDKVIFAIIGYIHPIKGQDIFIQAVNMLSESIRYTTEFLIVGRANDKKLYNELLNATHKNKNIKFISELPPEDMLDFYKTIDVVVCPSRCDTMPMVVAEGLMNHKVCIVSDNTGFTEFIKDKENGLICEAGNAMSLKGKMEWIINNQELIEKIGDNGRKIYDQYFAMKVFEDKLETIIRDLMGTL